MSELAIRENVIPALSVGPFVVTRTGLQLEREPSWKEWGAFFDGMQGIEDAVQWNIGDALVRVETQYGETAAQLTAHFPEYSSAILNQYRWVAKNVQFIVRTISLSWQHHYRVAALLPSEQKKWLSEAEEKGWTVKELRKAIREAGKPDPIPLPEGTYSVIYADPPWQFDNTGFDQSAASHYSTMATTEIAQLPIPEGMILFLWATCAMLEDALFVMKEWGYKYKTHMAWIKNRGPSIGWYLQTRHEILLIGINERNAEAYGFSLHPASKPISWHQFEVGRHSAKPEAFYNMIEEMYEGPYLELFARKRYSDEWIAWGNEIGQ